MLEAAVPVARRRDLEQIAIEGRATAGLASEKVRVPLADAREVGRQAIEVDMHFAGDRDVVLSAARFEGRRHEVRHLDRMIDQRVVVVRDVGAKRPRHRTRARHRGRDSPVPIRRNVGCDELHFAWSIGASLRAQEKRGTVEVTAQRIEVRGSNGEVEGIHVRNHAERTGARRRAP
jgi:hypothetical protein